MDIQAKTNEFTYDAGSSLIPAIERDVPREKSEAGPYPRPAPTPTQAGPQGIAFDFNLGARVTIPSGKSWRVRLRDLDTGNTLFESSAGSVFVNKTKRYFIRFRIEILHQDKAFFQHDYNATNRDVLIQFPVGTLGGTGSLAATCEGVCRAIERAFLAGLGGRGSDGDDLGLHPPHHTPYRVINYHACNSCWNDVRHRFDHKDFLWCPRHANSPRQFECTRLITSAQVIATLEELFAAA